MNRQNEGETTENTSDEQQTQPTGRLRDLKPEKDPMGAGKKHLPAPKSPESQRPAS